MKTEPSKLFDEFNRRYWRGRLPKYRVIRRDLTSSKLFGRCDNDRQTILLHKELHGRNFLLISAYQPCPETATFIPGPRIQQKSFSLC
jgi:hypothetical protein